MAPKISDHVIDALQYCGMLHGQAGVQTAYEKLVIERRVSLQPKAIEKISMMIAAGPSISLNIRDRGREWCSEQLARRKLETVSNALGTVAH